MDQDFPSLSYGHEIVLNISVGCTVLAERILDHGWKTFVAQGLKKEVLFGDRVAGHIIFKCKAKSFVSVAVACEHRCTPLRHRLAEVV